MPVFVGGSPNLAPVPPNAGTVTFAIVAHRHLGDARADVSARARYGARVLLRSVCLDQCRTADRARWFSARVGRWDARQPAQIAGYKRGRRSVVDVDMARPDDRRSGTEPSIWAGEVTAAAARVDDTRRL